FVRTYTDGTTVSVKAPAEHNGRVFVKFTIDGVDTTANGIQVTMNQNHTVIAHYVKKEYTLNVLTKPEDGAMMTVVPNDNNGLGSANSNFSRIYTDGTTVSVKAPSEHNGRVFVKFTIDGVDTTANGIQVTMNQDHTVIAYYVKKEYTLNVLTKPEDGAMMTVVPKDINELGSANSNFSRVYVDGTDVTVTAPAEHNNRVFNKFTIDGVDHNETEVRVTMNRDHTVIAYYVEKEFTLNVQTSPNTGAPITVTPTDNNNLNSAPSNFTRLYNDGTEVTVTAPASHLELEFEKWLIDGVESTELTIKVIMNTNHTVIAHYKEKPCVNTLTVKSSPTGATIEVSPADNSGAASGNAQFVRTYNCDKKVTVTAPLEFENKEFVKWLIDGNIDTNTTTRVNMNESHIVEAVYETKGCAHTLIVNCYPEPNVPVEISPSDSEGNGNGNADLERVFNCDTEVTVIAPREFEGMTFEKWIVDGSIQTDPTCKIVMSIDHVIEAVYVKSGGCEHILTVKSSPVDGIAIEVSPKDNKNKQHGYTEFKRYYSCDTEVRLVAPQNKECQDFIKWVIEETGAEYFTPEARLIMDSDYTATVYYSEAPSLALERLQLNFGSEISGPVTGAQELLIGNNGGGQLNWSVSADEEWIHFTPEAGDKSQHISVSVDPSGLPAGTYKGNLTIAGAQHESGHSVKVVLKVYEQGSKSTSFGELLTPKDKTVVRRNIPVTGWVLDEIECTSVKIFYSLFETPNSNVFLGDALFVPGARPDIEEAYPEYPKHHRSGYGFMLLTNTLPNEGNGDFYIKAVAVDITGNEVLLGTHLISVDNEHAVKPFGAIESPEKSSEISGFEYINTAWVVTYEPNMIPTDGSTIKGWIDGVPLKDHPFYNMENRTVLEKFPTVNNAEGASGYYVLDTTEYTNGSHNVTWSASDTNGNLAAVGSRYFDILNAENEIDIRSGGLPAPACTPVLSPVNFRKGYDINTAYEAVEPDSEGVITVTVKEDERLEIDLIIDEKEAQNINRYYGYMLQGGEHKILPVGSTLNGNGMFYWQPGAGFVGEYTLVFIARSSECEKSKKTIKVIIEPKF
ncbi:MAG: hypothetical protein GY765_22765, partial [bacterium]|nr:hypothetical protein [bacterium]